MAGNSNPNLYQPYFYNTMKRTLLPLTILLSLTVSLLAQTPNTEPSEPKPEPEKKTYPEIKGYVGLVHPLYTWSSEGNQSNFKDYYLVGNPWGINIWKSNKVGLSFEFTPFIRTDDKTSKLSNFLFHPGVLYRLAKNTTAIGRLAYETSGRFGFTPILSQVLVRGKQANFFVAALLPVRFGNDHAPSVSVAFQFGVGF